MQLVGQLLMQFNILCSKSKGRLKKVYGYLIGTELNANRLQSYNRFPNGKGWFSTSPITEHSTSTKLGELYSEILYYEDVVDKAEKRLEVYKRKLNLSF